MLGVVPIRRSNTPAVFMTSAWNMAITIPFTVAFWGVTEGVFQNRNNCFGVPWDVANFARWTFLAFNIVQLCLLGANLAAVKSDVKKGIRQKHYYLQSLDLLHWMGNWALFSYLVTGLAHRGTCYSNSLKSLFWATVLISSALGVLAISIGLISLLIFFRKILKELGAEALAKINAHRHDVIVKDPIDGKNFKVYHRGVELPAHELRFVDTRLPTDHTSTRTVETGRVHNLEDRVLDKNRDERIVNRDGIQAEMLKKDNVPIRINDRDEAVNFREEAITHERNDFDRKIDTRHSNYQSKF